MESAATHPGDVWAPTSAVGEHRTVARRLAQALVLLPLFSLILLPEYVQGPGDPETKSVLYRFNLGPLRLVDALLLMLIAAHVMVWASSRSLRVKIPRPLVAPALGFAAAIMLGMAYGALHGGSDLFFDWRALALGSGLYIVFALWTQDERDAKSAMI